MSNNVYGIDLGTNNFKVYSKATGKTMLEKNTIAVIDKNHSLKQIIVSNNSLYNRKYDVDCLRRLFIHGICAVSICIYLIFVYYGYRQDNA